MNYFLNNIIKVITCFKAFYIIFYKIFIGGYLKLNKITQECIFCFI